MKGLSQEEKKILIPEGTILLGYRGSIAHGMYVPQENPDSIDDKDIMGIRIADLDYYFGLKQEKAAFEIQHKEWDAVHYEIRKMFFLLKKSNPNVLSLLWLQPTDYISIHPLGQDILDNRDIFVSRAAYFSFCGYAKSQLHKMTHLAFEGYMGEKRKALVKKFGYDTKNGAHLIRLLRMGIEFLKDGELYVRRTHDNQELLDIKRGEWSLEKVQKEAERLFIVAEEMYLKSTLRKEPQGDKINELLVYILKEYYRGE